jgi:hypothetical protein
VCQWKFSGSDCSEERFSVSFAGSYRTTARHLTEEGYKYTDKFSHLKKNYRFFLQYGFDVEICL